MNNTKKLDKSQELDEIIKAQDEVIKLLKEQLETTRELLQSIIKTVQEPMTEDESSYIL